MSTVVDVLLVRTAVLRAELEAETLRAERLEVERDEARMMVARLQMTRLLGAFVDVDAEAAGNHVCLEPPRPAVATPPGDGAQESPKGLAASGGGLGDRKLSVLPLDAEKGPR